MNRSYLLCIIIVSAIFAIANGQNISDSEWKCDSNVTVVFGDGTNVTCGTEVLQGVTSIMPRLTLPSANLSSLYSVIVIDRDAPNASAPIRSPLRHMTLSNVSGSLLYSGLDWATQASSPSIAVMFNYSGPQPPAGSLCHRYYVQVYMQTEGIYPTLNTTSRYSWNFPAWAAQNNLTKVACNYWQTQNAGSYVSPCAGASPSSSSAGGSSLPLALGFGLGGTIVILLFLFWRCGGKVSAFFCPSSKAPPAVVEYENLRENPAAR